jgi:hypothetical protein
VIKFELRACVFVLFVLLDTRENIKRRLASKSSLITIATDDERTMSRAVLAEWSRGGFTLDPRDEYAHHIIGIRIINLSMPIMLPMYIRRVVFRISRLAVVVDDSASPAFSVARIAKSSIIGYDIILDVGLFCFEHSSALADVSIGNDK